MSKRPPPLLRSAAVAVVCVAALAWPLACSAEPSQSQIAAMRQACRADYMRLCASIPPGGAASLQCLQRNAARLSRGCGAAVAAVSPPPAPAPAAQEAAAEVPQPPTPPDSPLWPHTIEQGARATVYQPQVLSWPERKHIAVRAAVAITPKGADKPFLGTIELEGDTSVDLANRDVVVSHLSMTGSHFPTLDTARAAEVDSRMREAVAKLPEKHIPLDTVLLSPGLADAAPQPVAVSNEPPVIYARSAPASLVVYDGPPVLVPITGTSLRRVVNTNWTVLVDGTGPAFLLANGSWYAAPNPSGPWTPTTSLPPSFRALPADPALADARQAIPAKPAAQTAEIIVSEKPAELIVTAGEPELAPVPGTTLQVVTNTDSTLYRAQDGTLYYLTSGRWFSAPSLSGPWTYATPNLPPDFSMLPPDGPHADVLASVPGTAQAQAAVLQASLPQQNTIQRQGTTLNVTYAGAPQFQPIPGTNVSRSLNSPYGVIKAGERYYVCWQGAWFVANSPTGPFVPATEVPGDIYRIPPSDPLYPATYVHVASATPTAVTYGYTAGYALGFISAGVLVYGTGYYYPPVVVAGPVPAYFPYPQPYVGGAVYHSATGAWAWGGYAQGSYGGAARWGTAYNPATGAWARGGAVYGPNGGVAGFNAYNPSTGSWAHGSASWGAYGGHANASYYNARTGVSGSTQQNFSQYGRTGSSTFTGPSQTVHTASGSNARGTAAGFSSSTGAEGAVAHGRAGNTAAVGRTASGNIYAGANGNVYRHTDDGWSKWDNGGWNPVQRPNSGNPGASRNNEEGRLEGDRFARTQGGFAGRFGQNGYGGFRQEQGGRFGGFGGRLGGGFRR
jgi:hypothetical protein